MKPMKNVTILTILFLLIFMAGCETTPEENFAAVQKKLMPAADEMTKAPAQNETADEPYIAGKIAVYSKAKIASKQRDSDGKAFFMTPLYFREMEEIYANSPEEVGMVAVVDCDTVEKGVYKTDDGREMPAEVEDCELTLIDRTKNKVILKKFFEKSPDAESRVYGNSINRQTASIDVAQFLKDLPRR